MKRFSFMFLALCGLTLLTIGLRNVSLRGQTSADPVSVELTITAEYPVHVRAKPEKRSPSTGNDGTLLTVEFRSPGSTTPIQSTTVNTSSGGTYSGLTVEINPGTYDVAAKGYSHLRITKTNVAVASGSSIDFTANGTDPLLSGDVNDSVGDNTVNGIDLTLIVGALNGGTVRYDLNRDGIVNGIDLTNLVTNLGESGDA